MRPALGGPGYEASIGRPGSFSHGKQIGLD